MSYNPYQAPRAIPSPDEASPIAADPRRRPQPWQPSETIQLAWECFKREWLVLAGSHFLAFLITCLPMLLPALLLSLHTVEPRSFARWVAWVASNMMALLVGTFLEVGLIRMWLTVARGQQPEFGTLFGGGRGFLPYLGLRLLTGVLIALGFLVLIVPCVIVFLGLSLAPFYLVDAEYRPVEAMKESWKATAGSKARLFFLSFLATALAVLGGMGCCIGYFVAAPIGSVAFAIVYIRLSGRGMATGLEPLPRYPGYAPGPYG